MRLLTKPRRRLETNWFNRLTGTPVGFGSKHNQLFEGLEEQHGS